jgi:hypothetical protein
MQEVGTERCEGQQVLLLLPGICRVTPQDFSNSIPLLHLLHGMLASSELLLCQTTVIIHCGQVLSSSVVSPSLPFFVAWRAPRSAIFQYGRDRERRSCQS